MRRETKLWLRKKTLMALRALIWHADEWLHSQEVKLRETISLASAAVTVKQSREANLTAFRNPRTPAAGSCGRKRVVR